MSDQTPEVRPWLKGAICRDMYNNSPAKAEKKTKTGIGALLL